MKRHTPAEWSPQYGVLLTWPHHQSDWASILNQVEPVYTELSSHISRYENLVICCRDQAHHDHIVKLLKHARIVMERVSLYIVPANDTWTRDYGPITVLEGNERVLLNFTFNGWGGKFNADSDNEVTRQLHALGAFNSAPLSSVDMVLEGGSIDSDGEGSLLTTSKCLLTPTRNPHLSRIQIESRLKGILGVDRILWLEHGMLLGDDTDSHVDVLARFCDNETIAYTSCNDKTQGHYNELKLMETELGSFRTTGNEPYRLVPLPVPSPKHDEDGMQLPASYANFLIINKAVLVPTYNDPMDAVALERLSSCFPGREVIGINCLPLIFQHGSLHCITMQLPAGIVKNGA